MYNKLVNSNLELNVLLNIKYPNSKTLISRTEQDILKDYKTGIVNLSEPITKLECEAIRIINNMVIPNIMVYTQEREKNTSNKHIHSLLSANYNDINNVLEDFENCLINGKLINKGYLDIICKVEKECKTNGVIYKDTKTKTAYWEYKANDFIYYIQPILEPRNAYTYINKHQSNPYNKLNYISK